MQKLVVGTRIHTNGGTTFPDMGLFSYWCKLALEYADYILIATDKQLYPLLHQMCASLKQVYLFQLNQWNSVVTPLNLIVDEAKRIKGMSLLLQSFEIFVSLKSVEMMYTHLDMDTVVVGARLNPDHGGTPGIKPIDGLTSPWNTLALWDLNKLYLTGFQAKSVESLNGIHGGMEEVPTISLLQHLCPDKAQAKVVTLQDVKWNMIWNDEKRSKYHLQKMKTKRERAEIQLKYLDLPRGMVTVFQ